jgi:hypothetical protein
VTHYELAQVGRDGVDKFCALHGVIVAGGEEGVGMRLPHLAEMFEAGSEGGPYFDSHLKEVQQVLLEIHLLLHC